MSNKTITELAYDFLAIVRKKRVGTVLPYEIAAIFNQATENVITAKLKNIEADKKAYNDLLPLKDNLKATLSNTDTNDLFPNKIIQLPSNFRRDIRLAVKFGSENPTKLLLLKSNETTDILNGVFSRPSIHQTYYQFFNVGAVAYLKVYIGSIPNTPVAFLEYYRQPKVISENSVIGTSIPKSEITTLTFSGDSGNIGTVKFIDHDGSILTFENELNQDMVTFIENIASLFDANTIRTQLSDNVLTITNPVGKPLNHIQILALPEGLNIQLSISQYGENADLESEFGIELNKEIVETAASMYLERVQDARVSTFSNEINNK